MYTRTTFLLLCVCFLQTIAVERYKGRGKPIKVPGGTSTGMTTGGTGVVGITKESAGSVSGGDIPGGIGACLAIVPFHRQVADFALREMGTGYILREILGVRTSIVAGTMYHMELYVATSISSVTTCMHCDVKVVHQPRMPIKLILHKYQCKDTCCRGNFKPVDKY